MSKDKPDGHDAVLPQTASVCFRQRSMDTGAAWVVLTAASWIHVVLFGILSSQAIFYSEFLDDFQRGPIATSMLISTNAALCLISGPIGSILANKFSYRLVVIAGSTMMSLGYFINFFANDFWTLFCSHSILTGLGWGITYTPTFGILAQFFCKRKQFATSLCTVASGLGRFIVPPLLGLAIGHMSWRGASLILSGISLNMIPCAMFFITSHNDATKSPPKTLKQSADVSLFSKASFYIVVTHFFFAGSLSIFNIIGLRFAVDQRGVSQQDGPLLLSAQGAIGIFGRLTAMLLGLSQCASSPSVRFGILHSITVVYAAAIMIYTVMRDFIGLMAVSGIVGFCHGLRYALLPAIMIETFSAQRFSTSWAYGMCIAGIGGFIFPPLGEWLAVVTGRPDAPFFLSGAGLLAASSCILGLQCYFPYGQSKKRDDFSKHNNSRIVG